MFNFSNLHLYSGGCSSAGRAPALHAGGHRFEPVHLHHFYIENWRLNIKDSLVFDLQLLKKLKGDFGSIKFPAVISGSPGPELFLIFDNWIVG